MIYNILLQISISFNLSDKLSVLLHKNSRRKIIENSNFIYNLEINYMFDYY